MDTGADRAPQRGSHHLHFCGCGQGHERIAGIRRHTKSDGGTVVPKLPATIDYEYGGMQEVDNEVIPLIIQIILAGIFLIFLFLIYNYRKISVSLAALLSMLFCIPGTVWGLYLTDTAFSLTCILGIISLMGVIIRNAIMIFDHAENLRLNARLSARQAAYEAGKKTYGSHLPDFGDNGYRYRSDDSRSDVVVDTNGHRDFYGNDIVHDIGGYGTARDVLENIREN